MSDKSSKTEAPTPKRLKEAQDEGRFARAPEIGAVAVIVAGFGALLATLREKVYTIVEVTTSIFSHLGQMPITQDSISEWAGISVATMVRLVYPVLAATAVAGALASGAQSRFHFTTKVLEPKLERLNPVSGLKRIFSKEGAVRLALDLGKLVVLGVVLWAGVKQILADPLFYTPVSLVRLGSFMKESAATLVWRFALALSLIAGVSYFYQYRKLMSELRMTKQEVKDEHKNAEGDPHVKARLRAMARQLIQRQMLRSVEHADVVLTNPTHYAVALRYIRGEDRAPVVVAKGERLFAQRIKEIAKRFNVPMVENKPVARMLFKYGKVGHPIPVEMYQAVAEILAYVYKTHRYYFHTLKYRRAEEAAREKKQRERRE